MLNGNHKNLSREREVDMVYYTHLKIVSGNNPKPLLPLPPGPGVSRQTPATCPKPEASLYSVYYCAGTLNIDTRRWNEEF